MTVYDVTSRLPEISAVRGRAQAMAVLDVIMCDEPSLRYYAFDPAWSGSEMLASMHDGSGNDYSVVFSAAGAFARGFDHESPMTPWAEDPLRLWPGLVDSVPEAFQPLLSEPSFCESDGTLRATVCFWRESSDAEWRSGAVDLPDGNDGDVDGASWIFDVLVAGTAAAYREFAEEYYEKTPDLTAIQHVLDHQPLTDAVVALLNPDRRLGDIHDEVAQTGYGRELTVG
ncbi:hypothetical protein ACIRST_10130 [Kitasatospora sp. NPDC101447]|uniref:hypothetical protein n=1 Tax=Kitasatospora sp. NPDC101447 TaxID=3364102 RepID=UPI00382F9A18